MKNLTYSSKNLPQEKIPQPQIASPHAPINDCHLLFCPAFKILPVEHPPGFRGATTAHFASHFQFVGLGTPGYLIRLPLYVRMRPPSISSFYVSMHNGVRIRLFLLALFPTRFSPNCRIGSFPVRIPRLLTLSSTSTHVTHPRAPNMTTFSKLHLRDP